MYLLNKKGIGYRGNDNNHHHQATKTNYKTTKPTKL